MDGSALRSFGALARSGRPDSGCEGISPGRMALNGLAAVSRGAGHRGVAQRIDGDRRLDAPAEVVDLRVTNGHCGREYARAIGLVTV